MSDPKRHHFIPQWILKNFTFDKHKKRINYIDKYAAKPLSSSLVKVARQHNLYKFSNSDACLEKTLFDEIDGKGAVVISKILNDRSIDRLNAKENKDLRRFVSAQILRVPAVLKQIEQLEEDLAEAFEGAISIIKDTPHSDFLNSIIKGVEIYDEILSKKNMTVLVQKNPSEAFVIGDVPVVQRNYSDKVCFARGYSKPVIDWDFIALPISPRFLLVYHGFTEGFDVREVALINNDWQFIQADRFVFSEAQDRLMSGMKRYHKNSYRYIESVRPDLIERYNLKYGDKLEIAPPRLAFADTVKADLRAKLKKEDSAL